MLAGTVAKQIFERARLPNEVLGRIWNLADTQGRGALDRTEFAIAMHLLASQKSGTMRGVPQTLPPGLYDAAAKRAPSRSSTGQFPGPGMSPVPGATPQFPGVGAARPHSPLVRQQAGTPLSAQSTGDGWSVSPADKARFDQVFSGLDKSNRGFITGDQAVEFFGNARLPEEILAQIWDLADIHSEGRLNRDEFAVAMYLIRQQRGTKEGRGNLPTTLPPALVPPMMRKQHTAPSQPTAPAFENAPVTKPRSAADDLFGLDAFAAAPRQAPQSTGGSTTGGPFQNPKSAPPPPSTTTVASPDPSSSFKPFVPSSSFGQSLAPQQTGFSATSQPRAPESSASDDLLGDADPEVSHKLTSETSELANLSNQVTNLSTQMQEVQGSRESVAQELSRGSQQKKEFEVRLSQLRSLYEKEVKDVKGLQEQLSTQRGQLKSLQQEVAMLDGGLQDLQNQRQQLSTALEAEFREKAALTEKIKKTNAEMTYLKPQVEKMKSEARQQKGLVAISKKQLATLDGERDQLQDELDSAKSELDAAKQQASPEAAGQVRGMPQRSSTTSPVNVASPAASVVSATNPFFRRGTDTGMANSERSFSPLGPSRQQTMDRDQAAVESMFGPSSTAPGEEAGPAPHLFGSSDTPLQTRQPADSQVTPSASPAASSSTDPFPGDEPPAPPKSRQITSAALPFRAPVDRAESISSSVKVALPASRLSPVDTPRAVTPSASVPASIGQNGGSPGSGGAAAAAAASTSPSEGDKQSITSPHILQPTPTTRETQVPMIGESFITRSPSRDIPGAFPQSETPRPDLPPAMAAAAAAAVAGGVGGGALAAGGVATDLSGSQPDEDRKEEAEKNRSEPAESNFDQYFGGPAHSRSRSEKAADLDAAFSTLPLPTTNGTAAKPSNKEFPPIEELDDDDDDDNSDDSDEDAAGFDDNFTIVSPAKLDKENESENGGNAGGVGVASAVPASLQARPPFDTVPSANSSLPEIDAQKSPPAYGETVAPGAGDQFPPEFKGLLPHRGDPTSAENESASGAEGRRLSQPYAPEAAKSPPEVDAARQKFNEDDFDAAFADLAPAPVLDDDDDDGEDDDEADEFNRVLASSQHNTEFDPVFDSPGPSKSSTTEPGSSSRDLRVTSDFYNFSSQKDAAPPAAAAVPSEPTNTFQESDWDKMFAALDRPSGLSPPADAANQTFPPPPGPPPSSMAGGASKAAKDASPSPAPPAARPALGRALSTGTEHDDPILQRLTAMGWSREESLHALEQYDYNLDKVSTIFSTSLSFLSLLWSAY